MPRTWTRLMLAFAIVMILAAALTVSRPARAASIQVNTLADDTNEDNLCTLREAVLAANSDAAVNPGGGMADCPAGAGGDTITFIVPGTITLNGGQIVISSNMTINGAGVVAVSAGNFSWRAFDITCCVVTMSGLGVWDGWTDTGDGGGIRNSGALTLTNSTVSNNLTLYDDGGGIYNSGSLTVTNSTISGNIVTNMYGGGIANDGGTVVVTNSTISGNYAAQGGGGIHNNGGSVMVTGSLITGNQADQAGSSALDGVTSVSLSCIQGNSEYVTGGYFDVTGSAADDNFWGDPLGHNQGGETTNIPVSTFLSVAPPCGATSVVSAANVPDFCKTDDRINCRHGDWLAVVYVDEDEFGKPAINIYCVDLAGKGHFGMQVTQADVDAFPATPEVDTLVKQTDKCRVPVRFYILTTGEYQINIGPDYQGKVEVIVFSGLSPTDIYFLRLTED